MSWQVYVDNNLVGTGKISKAAIVGQQGGIWASSPGYTLSPEEQQALIAAFKNPEQALQSGVRLNGQKFFVFQAEPEHIYGKKQADGVVIVKTTQAILVAEYEQPIQHPEATPVVESLGDYLKGVGY